jgi:DNA-binding transcriptional regulator YhcF (GntR family)
LQNIFDFPFDSYDVFCYSNIMTISNTVQDAPVYEPLKMRTRDFLLEQIRRGLLKPGQHVPSVREISRNLDVSTNVAFLAIKELREERILEKLANGRHLVGKGVTTLLQKRSLSLGFSSWGAEHIKEGIYQSIYNFLVRLGKSCNTNVDCLLDLHDTWSHLAPNHFDAMVVADWKPENIQTICRGPSIGLDTRGIVTDCVVKTDHHKGGELAGRHLRELGRKKVIYWGNIVESTHGFQGMVLRRLGFSKGWVDAGGELNDIKYLPVMTMEKQDLKPLIKEHLKGVDAFFVYCDSAALEMWEALTEMGIRVPGDLALIGYDGAYGARKHDPPLTTILQPCREIAEKIFELVTQFDGNIDSLKGNEYLIPPTLLAGGST